MHLYETAKCQSEPELGCHRAVLTVFPAVSEDVTVIGDWKDGEMIPFQGQLSIGVGGLSAAVENAQLGMGFPSLSLLFEFILMLAGFGQAAFILR